MTTEATEVAVQVIPFGEVKDPRNLMDIPNHLLDKQQQEAKQCAIGQKESLGSSGQSRSQQPVSSSFTILNLKR